MYKVLIVDDEPKVGKLINSLVQWEDLGLDLLDIVQNGRQAFDLITEHRPEIVITDIRMPGMDGLELISAVREKGLDTRFIVISGYRHFEYAHNALKFGVADYLIKPVDETELNTALQKLCQAADSARTEGAAIGDLQHKAQMGLAALQKEFIAYLGETGSGQADLAYVNAAFGLEFAPGPYQVWRIKADQRLGAGRDGTGEAHMAAKLAAMARQALEKIGEEFVAAPLPYMELAVILPCEEGAQAETGELQRTLFGEVSGYFTEYEGWQVSMGAASAAAFAELPAAYACAGAALQARIFDGAGKILHCGEAPGPDGEPDPALWREFDAVLEIYDVAGVQNSLGRILRAAESCGPQQYHHCAERAATSFLGALAGLEGMDTASLQNNMQRAIHNATSTKALQGYLGRCMAAALEEWKAKQAEMDRRPIREATKYIRENYGDKITLEDVASASGFNPNYFCELFKRETGQNFSDYLLQVRMEAAKDLLRDTREPVYTVAERVGYRDSKFFSQQFTKHVGVKPAQFRKLYN